MASWSSLCTTYKHGPQTRQMITNRLAQPKIASGKLRIAFLLVELPTYRSVKQIQIEGNAKLVPRKLLIAF